MIAGFTTPFSFCRETAMKFMLSNPLSWLNSVAACEPEEGNVLRILIVQFDILRSKTSIDFEDGAIVGEKISMTRLSYKYACDLLWVNRGIVVIVSILA
jgi:hypothetical protein